MQKWIFTLIGMDGDYMATFGKDASMPFKPAALQIVSSCLFFGLMLAFSHSGRTSLAAAGSFYR